VKCKCGKTARHVIIEGNIEEEDGKQIVITPVSAQLVCKCGLRTYFTESELKKIIVSWMKK
jgi:preprotein translocase subunit Sec61beta